MNTNLFSTHKRKFSAYWFSGAPHLILAFSNENNCHFKCWKMRNFSLSPLSRSNLSAYDSLWSEYGSIAWLREIQDYGWFRFSCSYFSVTISFHQSDCWKRIAVDLLKCTHLLLIWSLNNDGLTRCSNWKKQVVFPLFVFRERKYMQIRIISPL